jgi:hypothetical protein
LQRPKPRKSSQNLEAQQGSGRRCIIDQQFTASPLNGKALGGPKCVHDKSNDGAVIMNQPESTVQMVKELAQAFASLAQALAWPIVVLVVARLFRQELRDLVERLAALVPKIGSLKFPGGEIQIQRAELTATAPENAEQGKLEYVDARGFYTALGLSRLIQDSGHTVPGETIQKTFLLFQTARQQTWLLITGKQVFCILDDERTRASGRVLQWRLPLDKALPVRAYVTEKGNCVVDIGEKRRWLYSPELHPDTKALEEELAGLLSAEAA